MLELKNITKIYTSSKEKNKIYALNKINLAFPETGFVFILGPSGCGKSTLLNLLGGLDFPTDGQIKINHQIVEYSEKSLDSYRNQNIGFVFQDYNLIQNITIFDNLSLACFNLSKEEKIKKIKNVLSQVGLNHFEKRLPTELSGGQMQRVAIARALLKDCKILLADEPTGNLNSEMSLEIMELLKTLSKEKLIIVVSHNESLANQYAKRCIYLRDGEVIKDTDLYQIENNKLIEDQKLPIKKLSNATLFKMVGNNLAKKKWDTIISTIMILLSFIAMFISFFFSEYNRKDVDVKNLPQFEYAAMVDDDSLNDTYKSHISEIKKLYPELIAIEDDFIKSFQDLIDFGFILYPNYEEITEDGIYILDSVILNKMENGHLFYDQEGKMPVLENTSLDSLTGTYVRITHNLQDYLFYRINGIYKDKRQLPLDRTGAYYKDMDNYYNYMQSKMYYQKYGKYHNDLLKLKNYNFSNQNFLFRINDDTSFNVLNDSISSIYVSPCVNWKQTELYQYILTDKKIIEVDEKETFYVENENEIYLTLPLYNMAFKETKSLDYYIQNDPFTRQIQVLNYASHIDEEVSIEIKDKAFNDYHFKNHKYIFKGILLDKNSVYTDVQRLKYHMIVSESYYLPIIDLIACKTFKIRIDSILNLRQFIKDMDKISSRPYYAYMRYIDEFENDMSFTLFVFTCIFVILIAITILQQYLFMKRNVKNTSKEIGILRSIGIRKNDILKIYLLQILAITSIILLFTFITTIIAVNQINLRFVEDYTSNIYVLFYKGYYIPLIIVFIVALNFLASSFTLFNLIRRRTIDVIRNE